MRTINRLLIFPALVLAITACGRPRTAPDLAGPLPSSLLHIDNHHWLDVEIYVEHDGQRSRLGTVTATSSHDFTFPRGMLGQLGVIRLIADPIGSRSGVVSDEIAVKPGMRVSWTLESHLQRSSLAVY